MITCGKENMASFSEIALERNEKVLWHQNNIQRFQMIKNGVDVENRYFGDVYITNSKITFVDRKLKTEFVIPFAFVDHIIYKKPMFDKNYIDISSMEGEDKFLWRLTFEEDGACEFKNQLKKSLISEKVSTESPIIHEIKKLY